MEIVLVIIIILIIGSITDTIGKSRQKKRDIKEANRRRNYIRRLTESQIIEFAKKKGQTELSDWINYKALLPKDNSIKFYVLRGWDDNECVPWADVRRRSDNKVIYPTFD